MVSDIKLFKIVRLLLCSHAIASIMSCHIELMVDCVVAAMLLRVSLRVVVEVS